MNTSPPSLTSRVSRLFLGLSLCGVGIAAMDVAALGLGPWDVLHKGISGLTGIPLGTTGIVVGLALLVLWIPLRVRPGVGTIANAIWIGVTIDLALLVLPTPGPLWLRLLASAGGVVLFGIGTGYYIGVGMGPGPRDGLMTGIARRGLPVSRVRTGIELTALAAGLLLGGTVGIGTLLFAFGVGPVIGWALPRLTIAEQRTPLSSAARASATG